jgi:hypothetical protein
LAEQPLHVRRRSARCRSAPLADSGVSVAHHNPWMR